MNKMKFRVYSGTLNSLDKNGSKLLKVGWGHQACRIKTKLPAYVSLTTIFREINYCKSLHECLQAKLRGVGIDIISGHINQGNYT